MAVPSSLGKVEGISADALEGGDTAALMRSATALLLRSATSDKLEAEGGSQPCRAEKVNQVGPGDGVGNHIVAVEDPARSAALLPPPAQASHVLLRQLANALLGTAETVEAEASAVDLLRVQIEDLKKDLEAAANKAAEREAALRAEADAERHLRQYLLADLEKAKKAAAQAAKAATERETLCPRCQKAEEDGGAPSGEHGLTSARLKRLEDENKELRQKVLGLMEIGRKQKARITENESLLRRAAKHANSKISASAASTTEPTPASSAASPVVSPTPLASSTLSVLEAIGIAPTPQSPRKRPLSDDAPLRRKRSRIDHSDEFDHGGPKAKQAEPLSSNDGVANVGLAGSGGPPGADVPPPPSPADVSSSSSSATGLRNMLTVPGLKVFGKRKGGAQPSEPSKEQEVEEKPPMPLADDLPAQDALSTEKQLLVFNEQDAAVVPFRPPSIRAEGRAAAVEPPPVPNELPSRSVVRGRAARLALPAFDCDQCRDFYLATGILATNCVGGPRGPQASRHRYKHAPTSTPPGFWDLSFPLDMPPSQ